MVHERQVSRVTGLDLFLTLAQGVDGEMQAQKRRRRALLQDGGPRTPGTQVSHQPYPFSIHGAFSCSCSYLQP